MHYSTESMAQAERHRGIASFKLKVQNTDSVKIHPPSLRSFRVRDISDW